MGQPFIRNERYAGEYEHATGSVREYALDSALALQSTLQQHSQAWVRTAWSGDGTPAPRAGDGQHEVLQQLPGSDRLLFERLRGQTPANVDDSLVLTTMVAAKHAGILRPEQLDRVLISDQRLFVMGTTPGNDAVLDTAEAKPWLSEGLQANAALNQQLAEHQAMETRQRDMQHGVRL